MKNPALNKTQREIKNEHLEWKLQMLEVAAVCLRAYLKTKDEIFIKMYEGLKKEADYWDNEANQCKTI